MSEYVSTSLVSGRKCARFNCEKLADVGAKYCSRGCAPFAHLCGATASAKRKMVNPVKDMSLPGEILAKGIAKEIGASVSHVSRMYNQHKIPGRRAENSCVYFRADQVRAELVLQGWVFGESGRAIQMSDGRPIVQRPGPNARREGGLRCATR